MCIFYKSRYIFLQSRFCWLKNFKNDRKHVIFVYMPTLFTVKDFYLSSFSCCFQSSSRSSLWFGEVLLLSTSVCLWDLADGDFTSPSRCWQVWAELNKTYYLHVWSFVRDMLFWNTVLNLGTLMFIGHYQAIDRHI